MPSKYRSTLTDYSSQCQQLFWCFCTDNYKNKQPLITAQGPLVAWKTVNFSFSSPISIYEDAITFKSFYMSAMRWVGKKPHRPWNDAPLTSICHNMQPNANRDYAQPVKSHSPSQKLSKSLQLSPCVLVKDYTACFLEHSSQGEGGGGHLGTVKKYSLETYGKPQKALPWLMLT